MNKSYASRLVGHRGQMSTHPENTLVGYRAALEGGATYVECDIQLTLDIQPVVLHDHELYRTAGESVAIFDLALNDAKGISVHEPGRLGDKFQPEPLAELLSLLDLVAQYPAAKIMVELKQESIDQFGLAPFVEVVFAQAEAFKSQVIIISFNDDVVEAALKAGFQAGWVVENMDDASKLRGETLKPQYLITDVEKVDVTVPRLWQAPEGHQWQWMLYDIVDPEQIRRLMDLGVDLIETADVVGLVAHFESN